MTIRRALLISLTVVITISSVIVTAISSWSLRRDVFREAQERINSSLRMMQTLYDERLESFTRNIRIEILSLSAESCCSDSILGSLKRRYDLDILNASNLDGTPMYGDYPDRNRLSPLESDPLWKKARSGETVWGTVQLDSARLVFEGGDTLIETVMIQRASG
ncbi:MAG: hypothetical protein HOC71_18240, partial [Candidatus Latescibacteria bacterium]|nr:hypothetical protein [Candidatus Latescibacterota bacterium]